ncbi:MAG: hypothetical protein GEU87_13635 [Alphaproteobacteria bacterium]|nr:hypothetical protein [Alphaproteobacteria bacterium]
MRIGALCERQHRAACAAAAEIITANKTRLAREQWAKARAIPVGDRKTWVRSMAGADYLDDVRFAIQEDQGIDFVDDDRDPDRVMRIAVKRPKNLRQKIIAAVALQCGIKEGAVSRYWKEFRRMEKDTVADL